ncbi:MAG: hypothetical protein KJ060_15050 [Candidatus Hydrogenedentes bacterium]|nr:hypothetical protein [Candidatus Hydrogenedentota bacterium]
MAKDAPYAVIIRRGPAKSVATVGWDRATDTFTVGQWLRGRIYERRSDLSPDGKHLIYFAMNGKWHTDSKGSWTAISRAPYLKAIGFWPKGDCWNGGGLFLSTGEYWLNAGCGTVESVRTPPGLTRLEYPFSAYYGGECPGVYYHRLIRDGWKLVACERFRQPVDREWQFCQLNRNALPRNVHAIFELTLPGGWTLRKLAYATCNRPGRGCYFDEHELENAGLDDILDCRDWEWADWDRGRLVWAAGGRIQTGILSSKGVVDKRLLYDFNEMRFEAVAAPYG